jgi:hypothetical protein
LCRPTGAGTELVVGGPKSFGGPAAGRLFNGVGQLLELLETEPSGIGVEELNGGDLVTVFLNEFL